MATAGPNLTGTGADDTSIGTVVWSTPTAITVEDGTTARNRNSGGSTLTSHYLKATNFGFTLPGGATINGITVEIKRNAVNSGGSLASDNIIKIVQGGTISGTSQSAGATWPGSLTWETFGGVSNLWGLTWTDTDINSSTFGVVFSCTVPPPSVINSDALVDAIRITITYNSSGGSFSTTRSIGFNQAVNRSYTY